MPKFDWIHKVLVLGSGVFVLFLAGLSWWWFAVAGTVGISGFSLAMFAPIAWFSFLRPYQQDRILTFRDPENDPMGAGWNILQSKIAIGGGGLTGTPVEGAEGPGDISAATGNALMVP